MATLGFTGYAPGAIKNRAQLLDIIIEARKSKKAIRLYAVEQGGYFSELFLTSKSTIVQDAAYEKFSCFAKSSWSGARYYRSHRYLGDLNIVAKDGRQPGHNRHQLFSNRRHATEYAEKLKGDAGYQQAVKEWHARCSTFLRYVP